MTEPYHNIKFTEDELAMIRQRTLEIYMHAREEFKEYCTDKHALGTTNNPQWRIEDPKVRQCYIEVISSVFYQLIERGRWHNLSTICSECDQVIGVSSGYRNKPVPGVELFESELMALDITASLLPAYADVLTNASSRQALLQPLTAPSWARKVGTAAERSTASPNRKTPG